MDNNSRVHVWNERVTIPTYPAAAPDRNPLFLEKRVYQGSSGKVYPHPVTDKIGDEKENREYLALFLENDYLKIMILPELGGRVQRAYDKTRDYDFVYYNRVIKPALVGLAGPWISGGIEFNWPQHHRPSTFDGVNWTIRENEDGSASVVVSEIENMFHTEGGTEFRLYPDKAYLELNNRVFNRTGIPQTFLWWANPAVAVGPHYRSVFPQDVTAVMDHGKRDVSSFPIATGTYYKVDYSRGVDISRYENLPVPTSYMAAKSDFDFVGGYDEEKRAGLLHVADHHVSPGKKQWTWGCGDFGKAWDRNLTDEDGPYFELMTGCFTDNQPDFSYLGPFESRKFTQYFMPYHDIGTVHNACRDLSLNLAVGGGVITVNLYCSGDLGECSVNVNGREIVRDALRAAETYVFTCPADGLAFRDVRISVTKDGREILAFDGGVKGQEIPSPAVPAPLPEECETIEDCYLYGTHVEQYRHATRRAEDYYREGLRRDPADVRLNDAYGMTLYKKGLFAESETFFRRAVEKITRSNPNPPTGKYHYDLGLSLFSQNKMNEAYDAFYKATWNADTRGQAYYYLALAASRLGKRDDAACHAETALKYASDNRNAKNLRALLTGETPDIPDDGIDIMAMYLTGEDISHHIINPNMLIDLSLEMSSAGFYAEAEKLLSLDGSGYPMVDYHKAYVRAMAGGDPGEYLARAAADDPYCCFPNRRADIPVLEFAIKNDPADFKAPYYLGCLLYDRERHGDAKAAFEESIRRGADFATPYRNLALLLYNADHDGDGALRMMEKAYSLDPSDARILYELDLLKKRLGVSPVERLGFLEDRLDRVEGRDDLYLEYITLLNLCGRYDEALERILGRRFHPWEGGEGKVPEQYIFSNLAIALRDGNTDRLYDTFTYPESLGEGKLFGTQENRQNYYLGLALEAAGDLPGARERFLAASEGISEPASAVYYNDQPPETIFYQGMALKKLGDGAGANERFDKLIRYAETHADDDVKIDYFAVSLPDLLVFDDDLNRRNRVHCAFMKALGLAGKGENEASREAFRRALSEDPNAFAPRTHMKLIFGEI